AAPRHYGELRRLMFPVSDKVLTEQLRQLERDGLVSREVQPPPAAKPALPPRTVYSLTEYGQSLYPVLAALCEWGRAHLARARGAPWRRTDPLRPGARYRLNQGTRFPSGAAGGPRRRDRPGPSQTARLWRWPRPRPAAPLRPAPGPGSSPPRCRPPGRRRS